MTASVGVVVMLILLSAVVGFCVGWIARRDENRRYRESRERYWQRQLDEALADRDQLLAEAQREPVPARAARIKRKPARVAPPPVLDAEVVEETPWEVTPVDLDNLELERGVPS